MLLLSWDDANNECQRQGGFLGGYQGSNNNNNIDTDVWIGMTNEKKRITIGNYYCSYLTNSANSKQAIHHVFDNPSICSELKAYVCEFYTFTKLKRALQQDAEDDSNNLEIIIGAILGIILLGGLIYFVYRQINREDLPSATSKSDSCCECCYTPRFIQDWRDRGGFSAIELSKFNPGKKLIGSFTSGKTETVASNSYLDESGRTSSLNSFQGGGGRKTNWSDNAKPVLSRGSSLEDNIRKPKMILNPDQSKPAPWIVVAPPGTGAVSQPSSNYNYSIRKKPLPPINASLPNY